MASTFSSRLRIELIGAGEQSGAWNNTTNTNLGTLIEEAISGVSNIVLTSTTYTLSVANGAADESRPMVLSFTGSPGAAATITAPAVQKTYIIRNATTGGFAISIKTSAAGSPVAVSIPNGATALVYTNGTDFYNSVSELPTGATVGGSVITTAANTQTLTNKTLTSPTINTPSISGGTLTSSALTTPTITGGTAGSMTSIGLTDNSNVAWGTSTISGVTAGSLIFKPNGAERFRFGPAGQLGIGGTVYGTAGQALLSGGASAPPAWGMLGLSAGGTNASITAAAGGVVYSTASALAVTSAGTSGQVLTSGGAGAPVWATIATITSGTSVPTTSGTSIDFTGIPSTAKRVTLLLDLVSNNGGTTAAAPRLLLQLGSTTFVTTGYVAMAAATGASTGSDGSALTSTTGSITSGVPLDAYNGNVAIPTDRSVSGSVTITNITGNTWEVTGITGGGGGSSTNVSVHYMFGRIALSGVLDRIRLTTVGGTNTFDAGTANILWE